LKYPFPLRTLHWLVAAIILGLVALGYYMTPSDTDNPQSSDQLYFWHKSFRHLVFLLMGFRLAVRQRSTVLPTPAGLPRNEAMASKVVHKLLYILAFVVPLLGYVQSSTYEFRSGVHFFVVDLPEVFPDDKQAFELTNLIHRICAYSLLILVGLHMAGALKYRFFDSEENDVLGRML
jgi:cytochrome b561